MKKARKNNKSPVQPLFNNDSNVLKAQEHLQKTKDHILILESKLTKNLKKIEEIKTRMENNDPLSINLTSLRDFDENNKDQSKGTLGIIKDVSLIRDKQMSDVADFLNHHHHLKIADIDLCLSKIKSLSSLLGDNQQENFSNEEIMEITISNIRGMIST